MANHDIITPLEVLRIELKDRHNIMNIDNRAKRQVHYYNYSEKCQKLGVLLKVLRLSWTIIGTKLILQLADENLIYTGHIPSKNDNRDKFKSYIQRQIIILL